MLHSAPSCPANSSNWSTRQRRRLNNEKLEEIGTVKERLASLNEKRHSLSVEEEARIGQMGEDFAEIWQSDRCPPTLKKMIFRTAMEEIIVRMDAEKKTLEFTIHWKGGAHTQLVM